MGLILLLLLLGISLSLPFVQTKLGNFTTDWLKKEYKADIKVEQVAISIFGGVKLKKVVIKDYKLDTMIYAKIIKTNVLSFKKLYNGDLLFGDVRLTGAVFRMKTEKGQKVSNFDKFIALFEGGKPSAKPFVLNAKNIYLTDCHYILIDENHQNPNDFEASSINADLSDFTILGPNLKVNVQKMAFLYDRGLFIKNLKANYSFTKKFMKLENLSLETDNSFIEGSVIMNYDMNDFADFVNKVPFDIKINKSSLASNDIRFFYKELGKNQRFKLATTLKGTLNDFNLINLNLTTKNQSQIVGNINFKNIFGTESQRFSMKGNFVKIGSNYSNLTSILPNVLGKNLPTSLEKLGQFDFKGNVFLTANEIKSTFLLKTSLGNIQSKLEIANLKNIDKAAYKGNIILNDFKIGTFLKNRDLGNVSLNIDVDGVGFKEEYLNTTFSGDVNKINYKGYNYSKIVVDGNFKKPIFKGKLTINDPNLFMDFDGLINLGTKEKNYDFHTRIDYANLSKLNLVKSDSISIFKGDIKMKIAGNTFDNMKGEIVISQTSFQNHVSTYYFDDFNIKSTFDENNIRTIAINSPDIIEGKIVGKYQFDQLKKMVENSLGSLYANYSPNKVNKGQYLKFDFAVYNKIIEIFYPGISLAKNTFVNGVIDSNDNDFKLNFVSPQINAFENLIDKINIKIDNKNPLFNAYFEIDSIKTKNYKIADFSMINVTANDTLFLRTEFKGGEKAKDFYNLNLYHTIDKQNNNVVGLKKSEVMFKDYLWFLNGNDERQNKIIFDKQLKNFSFDNIVLSHENQKVALNGDLKGTNYKDLNLSFTNINIQKLTPEIELFAFDGTLNGELNLRQDGSIYKPTASLSIDNLTLNDINLGKFQLDVAGDESFEKFSINSKIQNNDVESFVATGEINTQNKETLLNLDMRFDKLNLSSLNRLGGDIITNIKGLATGNINFDGNLNNLGVNGRLFLDNAGISIPYLNVNYDFEDKSIVDVTETSFIVRSANIFDTKYKTKGILEGKVKHKKFSDWVLDLNIYSNRFLALDTKDSEDAAYFGTAFIDGNASISGPTSGLVIKMDAKSEKGTSIKIPINDAEAVGASSYLHFLTSKEKYNIGKGIADKTNNYSGLELKFNFDIKENSEIEVILNRNSGHGMKGKGRGNLLLEINTQGKFNMYGDFQVYEGTYNFKYGQLIGKKFDVKKFGSIVWEGDPMRAILNLEAVYKTSANPAVLIENPSINKKVPVEVVIGIKGNLTNPEPDFSINFPTVSSVLKSELQYRLDDKDTRWTQAINLLYAGSFLSQVGVDQSNLTSNLFESASGLVNDIFQDAEGKLNVGFDYVSADKRPGLETDGRVGVTISSRINEKITINGKVGVPVGGINDSAIVGDVEILYRVNEDGTLNLKLFNKENDINYIIGQGIGYTQGLGASYEVDFDTFKELVNKIFKKHKIELAPKSDVIPDSSVNDDYLNFNNSKKKKATPKVETNAILNEEE